MLANDRSNLSEDRPPALEVCHLFTDLFVKQIIWRSFLFLWVLGMGYVILLWHSLSLPYNYILCQHAYALCDVTSGAILFARTVIFTATLGTILL